MNPKTVCLSFSVSVNRTLAHMSRRQRNTPHHGGGGGGHTAAAAASATPQALIFFDPISKKLLPPPLFIGENGSADLLSSQDGPFPSLPYTSRRDQPKSAVHWGQRKLFLSEMQLLTLVVPDPLEPHWIIYVGSAPGTHLLYLDRLFGHVHQWELVDPGKFDAALHEEAAPPQQDRNTMARSEDNNKASIANNNSSSKRPSVGKSKFTLRNQFFDNNAAYELMSRRLRKAKCPALAAVYDEMVDTFCNRAKTASTTKTTTGENVNEARTEDIPIRNEPAVQLPSGLGLLLRACASRVKTLFLSDVRSGDEKNDSFEQHVYENTLAQETWTDILQPSFAMLKHRLPYTSVRRDDPKNPGRSVYEPSQFGAETMHLNGRVLLPVFARLTSTEARLIVKEGALRRSYNHKQYEDQMFFFNSVLRETVHFAAAADNKKRSGDGATAGADDSGAVDNDDASSSSSFRYPFELDHRYDGATEFHVLQQYLDRVASRLRECKSRMSEEEHSLLPTSVEQLSAAISRQLHGTIAGAAKKCDDKLIELSSTLPPAQQEKVRAVVARADAFRTLPLWRTPISEDEVKRALGTAPEQQSATSLWPGRLFKL